MEKLTKKTFVVDDEEDQKSRKFATRVNDQTSDLQNVKRRLTKIELAGEE